jgi:hypothetical protein
MKNQNSYWQGFVPPQYIYANRRFVGIALDPPNFEPGSWIGAGKALFDSQSGEFLLTARPRKAEGNVRGFEANIYRSKDGVKYDLLTSLSKDSVSQLSDITIHSIEGTQLMKSPLTGKWHFYLSVDTGEAFIWGGVYWETLLLTAEDLKGPWKSQGIVLHNDAPYDANQARDSIIEIVDGRWLCVYKAIDAQRNERPGLATSVDGISWNKHGVFKIDGEDRTAFISGSVFSGALGPVIVGLELQLSDSREKRDDVVYADDGRIGHGGGHPQFVSYLIDIRAMNLETIFRAPWTPLSQYEHKEHPCLAYSSLVYDPLKNRILMYIEALDPKLTRAIGLNETVERQLVYEAPLW